MRRIASLLALLAIVAFAASSLTGADDDGPKGKRTLRIPFDNAFGLTEGGDLRVGGVRAGQTTKFETRAGPECQTDEHQADRAQAAHLRDRRGEDHRARLQVVPHRRAAATSASSR